MELHLTRLAVVYRLILLNQQIGLLLTSRLLTVRARRHEPSAAASRAQHWENEPQNAVDDGEVILEHLTGGVHDDLEAFLRSGAKDRQLFNRQTTTTLLRFNQTGSVDDELKPRIDRHSSVKWLAAKSGFNPDIRTVLVIHGYMSFSLAQQNWANNIRNLIYRWRDSANMFYVDWNHKANIFYPIYAGSLEGALEVAEDLRQIIVNLKSAFPSWDSSDIHLIGHSLGSHVSGRLGYLMSNKIRQISAMDPPDTLQDDWPADKKLTNDDAQFVISYVTDGEGLGSRSSQADVNLLVNGGTHQPGCVAVVGFLCRHMRAAYYNSHNMGKCIMVGYKADSYDHFSRGEVGYCEKDSDACVGAGNWWQYDEGLEMSEKHFRPGPNWLSKRRAVNSSNARWEPYNREYYVRLASEKPWCIFTYQVVVSLENISDRRRLKHIDKLYISLEAENITAGSDVRLKLVKLSPARRDRASLGPSVTKSACQSNDRSGGGGSSLANMRRRTETKTRGPTSAALVYTGLVLIEPRHRMYNLMPLRFTKAIVWPPPPPAQVAQNRQGEVVRQGEEPQVNVNFMSENRFERRQLYSGPVNKVYWYPPERG